jgi:hypothetical protein
MLETGLNTNLIPGGHARFTQPLTEVIIRCLHLMLPILRLHQRPALYLSFTCGSHIYWQLLHGGKVSTSPEFSLLHVMHITSGCGKGAPGTALGWHFPCMSA